MRGGVGGAVAAALLRPHDRAQNLHPAATRSPEEFPAGAGRDETFYACTACHNFKLVAAQGLTRAGWEDSINLMVRRHNMPPLDGKDREVVLNYLEAAYPPRAPAGGRGWQNPFSKAVEHLVAASAPQLRIALRVDPAGELRRRGEEHGSLAAEGAAQLGAREQRRKPRLAAGRHKAQPVERAGDHAVVDELHPGIAERATDLEPQLLDICARSAGSCGRPRSKARRAPRQISCRWQFGDVRGADRRSSGDARCDVVFLGIAAEKISIAAVALPGSPKLSTSLRPPPLT